MDASTGLIYVGNGQYYDPATGRFLTRDAMPGSVNPYVPWSVNPIGMFIGAFGLGFVLYRKKRGKRNRSDILALMFLLIITLNTTLTACCPTSTGPVAQPSDEPVSPPTSTPTTPTPDSGTGSGTSTPPDGTPTEPPPCPCTPTPTDDDLHITQEELTLNGNYRADLLETKLREEDPALLIARVSIGERMRGGSYEDQRQDGKYVMWNIKIRVAVDYIHYAIGSYHSGVLTHGDLYEELFTPIQYEAMTGATGLLSEGGAFFGTNDNRNCEDYRAKMANPCPGHDTEALHDAYEDGKYIWRANLTDAPTAIQGYDSFYGSMTTASQCGFGESDPSYSLPWKQLVPGGNRHFDCVFADNKYFGLPTPP